MVGLLVVLIVAAAVIGGALWVTADKSGAAAGPIPPVTTAPDSLAVAVDPDGATVLVGHPSAPVTVDVYEDFLCPACQRFHQRHDDRLWEAVTVGEVRVRYHPVNLLDDRSVPPGYSQRAANAALVVAAVAPDRFLDYHHSLFAAQPEEGARGYGAEQLIELGRRLGITDPRLADQITTGTYTQAIHDRLAAAMADVDLRRPHPGGGTVFGTPTVAVDGVRVDTGDPGWLDRLVSSATTPGSPGDHPVSAGATGEHRW